MNKKAYTVLAMVAVMAFVGLFIVFSTAFLAPPTTPFVKARVITIIGGETSATVTHPGFRVGKVIGATYCGTAAKTTNTMVYSAYCDTAGTATLVMEAACFTTGTFYIYYL